MSPQDPQGWQREELVFTHTDFFSSKLREKMNYLPTNSEFSLVKVES
jgi:hypothetical protein